MREEVIVHMQAHAVRGNDFTFNVRLVTVSDSHLGLIRDRVPVSSSERELAAADTSQNLFWRVLWAVGKRSEAKE